MVSGAGDAVSHRRRDLRSGFLLFSFLSVNLPKNPNLSSSSVLFFSDSSLWNGEREQCFITSLNLTSSMNLSLNRATDFRHHPNDILGHSNDSRSGPTLDVETFPLPLPSTLTPTPPSPARRSMPSTKTPANPPCLTLPSTRNPASTLHFSLPSISIPASTPHLVLPSTMTPAGTQHLLLLPFTPEIKLPPPTSSKDPTSRRTDLWLTKAKLGFCLKGFEPNFKINFGPLALQRPKPIISRLENITVDDLVKKAIRSMTGPSMFSVTFSFI